MPSAFARLWTAQSASDLGTYVSFVALPLVAVVELDASATELGLLIGAGTAPLAFAWPLFGVLADRVDRRRMMAVAYAGRALLYTWVPLAAATGVLTMTQLVVAYFLASLLKVGFDVAAPALLPALVNRSGLLAANSRLEATRSLAMLAGPALGGALAGVIRPSAVIALDAAAYLTAALLVATIRPPEPITPHARAPRAGVLREMRDGIAAVRHHPLLRPMAASSALLNAFYALRTPLVTLYVVRDLGMPPITPDHLLGRVTATFRWAAWAATPFAAAASGPLSDTVGVRTAIGIAGAALLLPALLLIAARVHRAGQVTRH